MRFHLPVVTRMANSPRIWPPPWTVTGLRMNDPPRKAVYAESLLAASILVASTADFV